MKIICHLVHPAHFHLFTPIITKLKNNGWKVLVTIRNKDILERLLVEFGIPFINIIPKENRKRKINLIISVLNRAYHLIKIARNFKPDVMISSSIEVAIACKIIGVPSILCFEDDLEQVKKWAYIAGPLASVLLCPESCSAYKWEHKTIKYNGYHELTYLHPNHYKKINDLQNDKKNKYLIRLARLDAYHDKNNTGIEDEFANKIINKLRKTGIVYISAEKELPNELEKLRLKIKPTELLQFMDGLTLYIGDSQTMAAEAAVLGVPSIRYNDFVGKLGYLEELEDKYGLTYGVKTSNQEMLLKKIDELLSIPNLKEEWQLRRKKMLDDKIDVTEFVVWFIENYPKSFYIMKENPDYQYNFK